MLAPDELLLLMTDGVAETHAPDGTPFGNQRLTEIARIYRREPAEEIVRNLYASL